MIILGIESSCDETSAAVVKDGRELISNTVATQIPWVRSPAEWQQHFTEAQTYKAMI